MKFLKIVGGISLELFAIAIAFAILNAGERRFENIVLASLVELYCLLRGVGFGMQYFFALNERNSLSRFADVLRLLNKDRALDLQNELKSADDAIERKEISVYINIGGLLIISTAATLALLHALIASS